MAPDAMRQLREWTTYAYGVLTGVFVASLVAVVLWQREAIVKRIWSGWAGLKAAVQRVRGGRVREERPWEEECAPRCRKTEVVTTPLPPRKPFEFRKRLWNEPPEGQDLFVDYSWYECFDLVQKEFKEMSGKDLEWKTKWLDLYTESWLLNVYRGWTLFQPKDEEASERDRAFYKELYKDLDIESDDVWKDNNENSRLHGKDGRDEKVLVVLVGEIRAREEQKRSAT